MGPRLYVLSAPRIMGSRCSQWGPSGEGFLEPAGEPGSLTTAVLPLARTFRGCPALCGTVGRALWPLLRLSGGNAAARALGKEPAGRCLRTLAGPRGTGGAAGSSELESLGSKASAGVPGGPPHFPPGDTHRSGPDARALVTRPLKCRRGAVPMPVRDRRSRAAAGGLGPGGDSCPPPRTSLSQPHPLQQV